MLLKLFQKSFVGGRKGQSPLATLAVCPVNVMSACPLTRIEVPLSPRLPVRLFLLFVEAPVAAGRPPAEDGQEAVHDAREEARLLAASDRRRRQRLWA